MLIYIFISPLSFVKEMHSSSRAVLTQGRFCPPGTFGNVWRYFLWSQWRGEWRCYWHLIVEAGDAATCSTRHRIASVASEGLPSTAWQWC